MGLKIFIINDCQVASVNANDYLMCLAVLFVNCKEDYSNDISGIKDSDDVEYKIDFTLDVCGGGDFMGSEREIEMTQEELDELLKDLPIILEELEKYNVNEVVEIPLKNI